MQAAVPEVPLTTSLPVSPGKPVGSIASTGWAPSAVQHSTIMPANTVIAPPPNAAPTATWAGAQPAGSTQGVRVGPYLVQNGRITYVGGVAPGTIIGSGASTRGRGGHIEGCAPAAGGPTAAGGCGTMMFPPGLAGIVGGAHTSANAAPRPMPQLAMNPSVQLEAAAARWRAAAAMGQRMGRWPMNNTLLSGAGSGRQMPMTAASQARAFQLHAFQLQQFRRQQQHNHVAALNMQRNHSAAAAVGRQLLAMQREQQQPPRRQRGVRKTAAKRGKKGRRASRSDPNAPRIRSHFTGVSVRTFSIYCMTEYFTI